MLLYKQVPVILSANTSNCICSCHIVHELGNMTDFKGTLYTDGDVLPHLVYFSGKFRWNKVCIIKLRSVFERKISRQMINKSAIAKKAFSLLCLLIFALNSYFVRIL